MKKGISPVVAVVLLIAIAVIAAVGVWYWVGSYTGAPTAIDSNLKTMVIQKCNGTHVYVQNTGSETMTGTVHFYKSDGTPKGTLNFTDYSNSGLTAGSSAWIPLFDTNGAAYTSSVGENTVYMVLEDNYQTVTFSC